MSYFLMHFSCIGAALCDRAPQRTLGWAAGLKDAVKPQRQRT